MSIEKQALCKWIMTRSPSSNSRVDVFMSSFFIRRVCLNQMVMNLLVEFFNPFSHMLDLVTNIHKWRKSSQVNCKPWRPSINNFKRTSPRRAIPYVIKSKLGLGKSQISLLWPRATHTSNKISKVLLVASVWPSAWGWLVVLNFKLLSNLTHKDFQ